MPDHRPADPAQLAREVAQELRKTHGIRAMDSGNFGVFIGPRYHETHKVEWTQLGPIAIALEIKKLEAISAMQDAGDT